jgi:ubiquinone/menaquinone biosynthesis C-methylase UbiE
MQRPAVQPETSRSDKSNSFTNTILGSGAPNCLTVGCRRLVNDTPPNDMFSTRESKPEELLQRSYYASTASVYDGMHISAKDEHSLALAILAALVKFHHFDSVLDVGSGTGRALLELAEQCPGTRCLGVEPVAELREVGYSKGLSNQVLLEGRGDKLPFGDNSFDVVCEFAVLHHVPQSRLVISEMCRVARRMVFISDCNFVAQGSFVSRYVKRILFGLKLWPTVKWIQTLGKGYSVSEDDGVQYSYSAFQDINYLRSFWRQVCVMPTKGESGNNGSSLLHAPHLIVICNDKIQVL